MLMLYLGLRSACHFETYRTEEGHDSVMMVVGILLYCVRPSQRRTAQNESCEYKRHMLHKESQVKFASFADWRRPTTEPFRLVLRAAKDIIGSENDTNGNLACMALPAHQSYGLLRDNLSSNLKSSLLSGTFQTRAVRCAGLRFIRALLRRSTSQKKQGSTQAWGQFQEVELASTGQRQLLFQRRSVPLGCHAQCLRRLPCSFRV